MPVDFHSPAIAVAAEAVSFNKDCARVWICACTGFMLQC